MIRSVKLRFQRMQGTSITTTQITIVVLLS
jgi:hypothetical protein